MGWEGTARCAAILDLIGSFIGRSQRISHEEQNEGKQNLIYKVILSECGVQSEGLDSIDHEGEPLQIISRKGVMRVRVSDGYKITGFHGHLSAKRSSIFPPHCSLRNSRMDKINEFKSGSFDRTRDSVSRIDLICKRTPPSKRMHLTLFCVGKAGGLMLEDTFWIVITSRQCRLV